MKHSYSLLRMLMLLLLPCAVLATKPTKVKWTVKDPYQPKAFIENKGQYDLKNRVAGKDILFTARQDGMNYFFTSNSIWIEHIEIRNHKDADDKDNYEIDSTEKFYKIEFSGANPSSLLTGSNPLGWYHNFMLNNIPVKSLVYKTLLYRNLYPGIDMEFYFPENKQGFEYSFIVHPGADVSKIKMSYPLNKGFTLNTGGNIIIKSVFGDFIDHAPSATQNGNNIVSSFKVTGGDVQFTVGTYDKSKTLIIDPWTNTVSFGFGGNPFDVDWDNAGNCYIYGGPATGFEVIKYNSSGTQLWSTTMSLGGEYGDFAVDRVSQSVYMVSGFANGGIVKLNSSGAQVATYSGNYTMDEAWRISFSRCGSQAVVAGGGIAEPSYQAYYLDTSLKTFSPVYVAHTNECCHDVWGVTLDNLGNCFLASTKTGNYVNLADSPNVFNNKLIKIPMPNLQPITWEVNDHYYLHEGNSIVYTGYAIGFNGTANSDSDVYTYDSYILKNYSAATGALVDSFKVNGSSDSTVTWGGLTSDDCGNIFLGSSSSVIQFNGKLVPRDTIAATSTIYDVMLDNNSNLYVCGAGFVSEFQVSVPSCSLSLSAVNAITNAGCGSTTGSVTVTPSGGQSPYNIVWNTVPVQTGPTATNLSPGTYIATIADTTCKAMQLFDTVVIGNGGGSGSLIVNSPTTCEGIPTTLTATGDSIYTWSPAIGLNATSGDSVIANPTTTTTYTVIGVIGGCRDTAQSVVTVIKPPNIPVVSIHGDTLVSDAATNNQWYYNDTLISGATNEDYIGTKSGWYFVKITNPANGCSSSSDSVDFTTGIDRIMVADKITVFPNPVNDEVFVKINSSVTDLNNWYLQVTNVLGQIIYRTYAVNYLNRIDMSKLPSAVYFIIISSSNDTAVTPVIKQ